MKKLLALMRRAPKRTSAVFAMVAVAAVVPLALNAWGPVRQTFTVESPAPHVTFNSITNNPNIGDERNFVGIREVGSSNTWYDTMKVQEGKEYYVRMYVHNNAADNLGLVAQNVTAKFNLPTNTAKSIQVNGFLSASNFGATKSSSGQYGEVYDHATFTGDSNFNLAYVKNSLKYENNVFGAQGVALPESIFTSTGAKLGYDKLDGKIPGCFKYAGYVTFKVKPQIQKTLDFSIDKTVRATDSADKTFKENVKVKPGEKVDFQIHFKNVNEATLNKVVIRDMLPAGLTYVPGTTYLHNANGTRQVADGITGNGLEIGNYGKGGGAYLKFTAQVAANDNLPKCGANTLKNVARATTEGYQRDDDATVTVDRYCKPEPKYTCDSLTVTKLERTKFSFDTKYTVENATFKHVTYVVRNAAGTEVYRGTNNTFTSTTVGTYSVEALVTVTVDGQDKTAPVGTCKATFEVEKEKKPSVSIDKKVDGQEHKDVVVGEEFTYNLTVKNTGEVDLTNVKVTDDAPAHVQFMSADKGTITDNKWSYTIASLKVGESVSIAIKAKVTQYVQGTIKNTACVDAPEVPGNPDDCDDATVKPKKPGVSIDKKVNDKEHAKVAVGETFTYQLVVKNTGETTLKNVIVTDNAPEHVQFISADKGTITNNKWGYIIPELKVGESLTVAIKAKVTKEVEGVITNTACVDAPAVPGTPDDCDDATVEVPPVVTPETPEIKVCDLTSKKVITIKEDQFDAEKHSKDLAMCAETPVTPEKPVTPQTPVTPTVPGELPTTGIGENLMAFIGLGSLVASIGYYVASRRGL